MGLELRVLNKQKGYSGPHSSPAPQDGAWASNMRNGGHFTQATVSWPEATMLTELKELIHLSAWMSGSGWETQFGSKLESDVMVIKWEKWMCLGQDLVNSGCPSLQIPGGSAIAGWQGAATALMYGVYVLINQHRSDVNEQHQGIVLPKPPWSSMYVSSFDFLNVRIRSLTHT